MLYIIIAILIIAVILLILKNRKPQTIAVPEAEEAEVKADEILPYKKKLLLTKNEWRFYKDIKPIANKYNLHILAKIRMADLVEVDGNIDKKDKQKYFNRIKSKHIDFALCKQDNLQILCLVELDDSSHNNKNRVKRDELIEKIYEKAGYKLIRVYGAASFEEELIKAEIVQSAVSEA